MEQLKGFSKEELKTALDKVEREETIKKEKEKLEQNFQYFLNRDEDIVIGLAHCEVPERVYYDTSRYVKKTIGQTISIHGNCGHSYSPSAFVTESTYIYFHNLWTDQQRREFQEKIDSFAVEEIMKITSTLKFKASMIDLQCNSDSYIENNYPEYRQKEVREKMWEGAVKVFDQFPDQDFLNLLEEETIEGTVIYDTSNTLERGIYLVLRYILQHRKELIPTFQNHKRWQEFLKWMKKRQIEVEKDE